MRVNVTHNINNTKARYEYFIEDTYRAGIVLTGPEVRAIRDYKGNISNTFCYFNENKELFLRNFSIHTLEENSDKKLLLTRKELNKLYKGVQVKGYTIVPLCVIIPKKGYIKVDVALCKGKHEYDKRETIKERDLKRELKK